MASFSKKLSMGTSQFAKQAMDMASTTFSAANTAIVAGLQTCDEKGAVKVLRDTELRISPTGDVSYPGQPPQSTTNAPSGPQDSPALQNKTSVPLGTGAVVINIPVSATHCETQIWGNHSFHFFFVVDSGNQNSSSNTSVNTGRLVAKARKSAGGIELPLRCRWKRKVSKEVLLDIFDENICEVTSYHVSADDVGCKVYVEAWIPSEEYTDQRAFAEIGPFEMNTATRKNLDNSMAIESTRFPLKLLSVSDPDDSFTSAGRLEDNNVMLHVSSKEIRIVKPGPRGVGFTREWIAKYGAEFPLIQMQHTDSCSFELKLGPDTTDDHLRLAALSRSQRDLLTLTIRCFHARQLVATTAVIEQITRQTQLRQDTFRAPQSLPVLLSTTSLYDTSPTALDFYVIVHRLLVQIAAAISLQQRYAREKSRAVVEKEVLEQDITATIEAYQQLLLSYQNDGGSLSGSKLPLMQTTTGVSLDVTTRAAQTANLENQLRSSQTKCKEYADELQLLRRDYRALEARNAAENESRLASSRASMNASADNLADRKKVVLLEQRIGDLTRTNAELVTGDRQNAEEKTQLSKEIERLRAHVLNMSSTKLTLDNNETSSMVTIDSTAVNDLKAEVKRLLSAVESTALEKQSALNQAHMLEQARDEVQESFLYIKNKYDDLLSVHKAADQQLVHQNNKLTRELRAVNEKCQRVEAELNELQEVMEALRADKNRLTRKNEVLAKDLHRYRDEIETSTKRFDEEQSSSLLNIQQLEKTIEEHKSALDDTARVESDMQKLAIRIEEKNKKIHGLEEECEQLRSRIRKLVSMGDPN
eukprot:Lankesteria_metandrocarpae@DN4281_c0_g1_i1.p1